MASDFPRLVLASRCLCHPTSLSSANCRAPGHQGTPGSDAVNCEKCCGVVRPLVISYIAIEAMAPVESSLIDEK